MPSHDAATVLGVCGRRAVGDADRLLCCTEHEKPGIFKYSVYLHYPQFNSAYIHCAPLMSIIKETAITSELITNL